MNVLFAVQIYRIASEDLTYRVWSLDHFYNAFAAFLKLETFILHLLQLHGKE